MKYKVRIMTDKTSLLLSNDIDADHQLAVYNFSSPSCVLIGLLARFSSSNWTLGVDFRFQFSFDS